MPLDPNEMEMIINIREGVARIEVHIERMDEEYDEKFETVHKRIDSVRKDLKNDAHKAGLKSGAGVAGLIASALAALGAIFR